MNNKYTVDMKYTVRIPCPNHSLCCMTSITVEVRPSFADVFENEYFYKGIRFYKLHILYEMDKFI